MFRILVVALVAYLVFRGIESVLRQVRAIPSGEAQSPRPPASPLARCAACGVHIPRSRTLTGPGSQLFCSEECHRRAAQSA